MINLISQKVGMKGVVQLAAPVSMGGVGETPELEIKVRLEKLNVYYGAFKALHDVDLVMPAGKITAIIGPSGCGKSTLLRSINRMTDLTPGARAEGRILLEGSDLLGINVDVVDVRRRVGMVFQRPNPFPKTIYENVAFGPRLYGIHKRPVLDEIVERSLTQAALWVEVKDKLNQSGLSLSGGQQQRLCIARAIAVEPEVILMDLPEDSPLRKPVLSIKRSGERAAAIAQDLLTLARRVVPLKAPVDLNGVIREYLESPEGSKLQSDYPNVQIEKDLEPGLHLILGSPVHLSKTVMNLALNAVEAIPSEGRVVLSTRSLQLKEAIKGYEMIEPGEYAVISVKDTGVGISGRNLEKIFEPFYTKKAMGRSGSGLGMAIVWGTVKDHRGYVDVKSEEGKGTTFDLYFPVPSETQATS